MIKNINTYICITDHVCSAFTLEVNDIKLITTDICFTDGLNNITVDLANLQMLVVDKLPCKIILGRQTMSTNNLYQTFTNYLSAHSNSLGEMLSCRCGGVTTKPLSNTQVFSSNTSVSDCCSGKTLLGLSCISKSQKLLSYGRIE